MTRTYTIIVRGFQGGGQDAPVVDQTIEQTVNGSTRDPVHAALLLTELHCEEQGLRPFFLHVDRPGIWKLPHHYLRAVKRGWVRLNPGETR
jgi:hypothetical protein